MQLYIVVCWRRHASVLFHNGLLWSDFKTMSPMISVQHCPVPWYIRGLYGYREWLPDFSYTLLLLTNGFVNPRQAYGLEFIGKNDSRSFVRN